MLKECKEQEQLIVYAYTISICLILEDEWNYLKKMYVIKCEAMLLLLKYVSFTSHEWKKEYIKYI